MHAWIEGHGLVTRASYRASVREASLYVPCVCWQLSRVQSVGFEASEPHQAKREKSGEEAREHALRPFFFLSPRWLGVATTPADPSVSLNHH